MLSYHNDKEFKAQMLEAAEAHRQADEFIRGVYGNEKHGRFRGCSVGCSLFDVQKLRGVKVDGYSDHALLADALGVPEWFTHLQDRLFEGVAADRASRLTGELMGAIPVGMADEQWETVEHRLHIFIQKRNRKRVEGLDVDSEIKARALKAINGVIDLRQKALEFGWDVEGAWSAEWSASSAAWSAEWSAASSAARSASSAAEYNAIADELIRLLEKCDE